MIRPRFNIRLLLIVVSLACIALGIYRKGNFGTSVPISNVTSDFNDKHREKLIELDEEPISQGEILGILRFVSGGNLQESFKYLIESERLPRGSYLKYVESVDDDETRSNDWELILVLPTDETFYTFTIRESPRRRL